MDLVAQGKDLVGQARRIKRGAIHLIQEGGDFSHLQRPLLQMRRVAYEHQALVKRAIRQAERFLISVSAI